MNAVLRLMTLVIALRLDQQRNCHTLPIPVHERTTRNNLTGHSLTAPVQLASTASGTPLSMCVFSYNINYTTKRHCLTAISSVTQIHKHSHLTEQHYPPRPRLHRRSSFMFIIIIVVTTSRSQVNSDYCTTLSPPTTHA